MCPVGDFVRNLKEIRKTDFAWASLGNYTIPDGDAWQAVTGEPPEKPSS
jgi:hypothetical protein